MRIFALLKFIIKMQSNMFSKRHIGVNDEDEKMMLNSLKLNSIDELIEKTIPYQIHSKKSMNLPNPLSEDKMISHMQDLAQKNKNYRSYIGLGYFNTILPGVIQRNVLGESKLVHSLHSISSRNCTRKVRSIVKFSNNGY